MGGGGSSYKRKSFKRRSSKISSEARKRKKSRRSKTKKLRHRDDSVSSYSDDNSTSSVSVSSYSSRDDYRNRRTPSRRQKDVRSRRKSSQRSTSSGERSADSLRVRKRKRSKRVCDCDIRKKTSRKKLRREASISSTSSDSFSCSTCRGSSATSSSKEREPERSRERYLEKKKDGRDLGKDRSGTKQTRYRSLSYSSRSKFSGNSDNWSGEKILDQNNSSRLRSIITIIKPVEEKVLDKDEEIVYDHEDYPSCRSNDSNEGGSKREIAQHVHVPSEKRGVKNEMGEIVSVSHVRTTPVEGVKGGGGQHDVINHASDYSEKENPNLISIATPSEGDKLESILRQKALENLRRFRREGVANEKPTLPDQTAKIHSDDMQLLAAKTNSVQSKSQSDVNQLSTTKALHVQNQSSKQDESNVMMALPKTRENNNEPSSRRYFIQKSIEDGKSSGTESATAKHIYASSSHLTAVSGNPKENHSGTIPLMNKSELVNLASRKESSPSNNSWKQAATSQETPKAYLLESESAVSENATEKFQTAGQDSGNIDGVKVTKDSGSPAPKPSGDKSSSLGNSSKEPQDEAKDGSQYQQKTMSVMRGGEMVQVSYKVYIPQNAPALARRKLQR